MKKVYHKYAVTNLDDPGPYSGKSIPKKKVYCQDCKWLGTKKYSSGTSYQACVCPNIPYRDSWYHKWQPDNPMEINENNNCKCFEEK